jgi:hypothetical protein
LPEKFDAIICYDSLHHFEDENAVMNNLAKMIDVGGTLFILEGDRPPAGSLSEDELLEVMNKYGTLESPFNYEHLRKILDENGFAVIGDYASINGLFPRDMIVDEHLALKNVPINHNYLACKKVADGESASTVPDSTRPNLLRAQIDLISAAPGQVAIGQTFATEFEIHNQGDTLWIAGQETRMGVVMPAVKIFNEANTLVREIHGEPPLPHSVAPGEKVRLRIQHQAPLIAGRYTMKIDLVDQHVSWFETAGSKPLILEFEVI